MLPDILLLRGWWLLAALVARGEPLSWPTLLRNAVLLDVLSSLPDLEDSRTLVVEMGSVESCS